MEKGRMNMESKCITEEAATGLVRRGKANLESVEEEGIRVNL